MTRVYLAQALCPQRHAVLAVALESDRPEEEVKAGALALVEERVDFGIGKNMINPWCGLCHAPRSDWTFEVGVMREKTLEEAKPALRQSQRDQLTSAALLREQRSRKAGEN